MAQWGNKDTASNSAIWAVSYVNKTPNTANRDTLFENNTPGQFVTGLTVGQYGQTPIETAIPTHAGWVLKKTGTGGRAGRIQYETLVAMSSITALESSVPGSFWYSVYGDIGIDVTDDYVQSTAIGPDDSIYITGGDGYGAGIITFIAKYDPDGTLLWQKTLDDASEFKSSDAIAVDPSGNVYVAFTSANSLSIVIIKLDSSGTIVWQKRIDDAAQLIVTNITVDANHVYAAINITSGLSQASHIVKMDTTAGNIVWQKSIADGYNFGVQVDPNGNVYTLTNNTTDDGIITKYDSSGNVVYQIKGQGGTANNVFYNLAVDENGNIYFIGIDDYLSNEIFVQKFDASGDSVWYTFIDGIPKLAFYTLQGTITFDSFSNSAIIFGTCEGQVEDDSNVYLMSLNAANGAINWVNGFGFTDKYETTYYMYGTNQVDARSGAIVASAYSGAAWGNALTLRVPSDGTKTGTIGDFSYYPINTVTQTTTTGTTTPYSATNGTGGLTIATSSLTITNHNYTQTLVPIP